jgi:hypothetical protein
MHPRRPVARLCKAACSITRQRNTFLGRSLTTAKSSRRARPTDLLIADAVVRKLKRYSYLRIRDGNSTSGPMAETTAAAVGLVIGMSNATLSRNFAGCVKCLTHVHGMHCLPRRIAAVIIIQQRGCRDWRERSPPTGRPRAYASISCGRRAGSPDPLVMFCRRVAARVRRDAWTGGCGGSCDEPSAWQGVIQPC